MGEISARFRHRPPVGAGRHPRRPGGAHAQLGRLGRPAGVLREAHTASEQRVGGPVQVHRRRLRFFNFFLWMKKCKI